LKNGPFQHHRKIANTKIKGPDGKTAETPKETADIFSHHLKTNVYNRNCNYNAETIYSIIQKDVNQAISETPSLKEFKDAIEFSKNGKSPGESNIPIEAIKALNDDNLLWLYNLTCEYWNDFDTDVKHFHTIVLRILPKKGDLSDPNNWRGIALQETSAKIISTIINRRLTAHLLTFS